MSDIFIAAWKPSLAAVIAAVAVGTLRLVAPLEVSVVADFALETSLFVLVYIAIWLVLPGGRGTLLELLSLVRELRQAPKGSEPVQAQRP